MRGLSVFFALLCILVKAMPLQAQPCYPPYSACQPVVCEEPSCCSACSMDPCCCQPRGALYGMQCGLNCITIVLPIVLIVGVAAIILSHGEGAFSHPIVTD